MKKKWEFRNDLFWKMVLFGQLCSDDDDDVHERGNDTIFNLILNHGMPLWNTG